jgi:Asp-tRNA(Asn)/Glu-tRNA(Gln) amidotransferase A subunit family amidase
MAMQHDESGSTSSTVSRRTALRALAGIGIGTAVFHRALAAQLDKPDGRVTGEMIQQAEWVSGIELAESEREAVARSVQSLQAKLRAMREVDVNYDVPPAMIFSVAPTAAPNCEPPVRSVEPIERAALQRPESDEALAFLPVTELSALIRTRQVTSIELTQLYLERLRRYDPLLKCVVTLTEDLAIKQAEHADREIAAGRYRGPLHGIPWGAKDLIAWPGYKTTWGAGVFQEQTIDEKATVARRLEEAGAVLVAKLTLGALALGDEWFGGMTRNPWNPKEGSSGSSAGSASATVAGLVGFAIGSETLGSIISPCTRCGASGLRPTFGRVSRHGCMSLAWSMDKLGPICRSVEDCALVFAAIHGRDGLDPTAVDRPFHWPPRRDLRGLTIGYVENDTPTDARPELAVLRELGVKLTPIRLPDKLPVSGMTAILDAEAAAVFDKLTRAGIRDGIGRWADTFRRGEFIPAIEYLRANRLRTLLMREMEALMSGIDAYVEGNDLAITNLTGHPTAVLPGGFTMRGDVEVPSAVKFTGRLFGETDLLALAHAYQQATGFHLRRPPLEV